MNRISGKINLMQLTAVRKMITGKDNKPVECIVLPIEKNKLFIGKNGVYLDLIAFGIDPAKITAENPSTHLLKQSFSKEVREAMTEDELKALPILGNLQVWSGQGESEPASDMGVQEENDNLPF